ncbi:MAG TPA: C1 family peptidase [Elusimicrobiota bacterium]|nr:C1 family peptidase [Elusimicrobiota bacterium]
MKAIAAALAAALLGAKAWAADDRSLENAYAWARASIAAGPSSWGPRAPAVGSAGAVSAPSGETVDLSYQFSGPSRSQGDIGSCHTFAAVALLEAAYYRLTGRPLRLSEADLFTRRTILSGDVYDGFRRRGSAALSEGNYTPEVIQYALQNGVATGMQYDAFRQRYLRYREAERRTLEDLERQRRSQPWYVRLLYDARGHWARLQQAPASQRILQRYLSGNDDALESQRRRSLEWLSGLRLTRKSFSPSDPSRVGPEECARLGRPRAEEIAAELRAGRPVAVSYSEHSLVIKGMRSGGNGTVFMTRNSHGPGGDVTFQPGDMCKIYETMSVAAR